jgi:APA family basic amino acid/polyamine antiporter
MAHSPKPIGLASATSLVVASMIGAGVFTTSGYALADLGTPGRVLAAWLTGGVVAVCGAVCYGCLARRFSESGGEYLFLARAVHPAAGFMAGWVSLLAGFTGALAFAATALESYLTPPGGTLGPLPSGTLAMVAVLLSALLHAYRVRPGAWIQNGLVALKFGLLLGLLTLAWWSYPAGWAGLAQTAAAKTTPFSIFAFAMSLMWISLSYSGFNAAVYIAGEVEQADKTVPRALLLGTVLVGLFYLALNTVFLWGPPPEKVAGQAEVAAIAAESLGGLWLGRLTRGVIVLSLFTSIGAMTMLGPRVYAKMADDHLFPPWFRIRGGVPRAAIGLQTVLALLVIGLSDLRELLSYLGFTLSVSAALTVSTLFLIRRREGAAALPVPFYPLPPVLFVGSTLLFATLAAFRNPWECVAGVVTIFGGWLVYQWIPIRESTEPPLQDESQELHRNRLRKY